MFASLRNKLSNVFDHLKNRGVLKEEDIDSALREIRISLIEADVALPVTKRFIADVKEQIIGQKVIKNLNPIHMIIKIIKDELVKILGEKTELNTKAKSPFSYLILGLQGAGKTTTSAKIGYFLKKQKRIPLLVSLDIYRPAAKKQLEIMAQKADLLSLDIIENEAIKDTINRAKNTAKKLNVDVIIYDTAGRLHIDEAMTKELQDINELTSPLEKILVADGLMGQDALNIAQSFNESVGLTGCVLTRLDGDGRYGAAFSIREVTKCPIKFLGVGEKIDQLDLFDPERIANLILDKGDIIALATKAMDSFQEDEMMKMAKSVEKGQFNLNDMVMCLESMGKMGGVSQIFGLLPGFGKIKEQMKTKGMDENKANNLMDHQLAIIYSMTKKERLNPKILNASRKKRIAKGCGQNVESINKLLKNFLQIQQVMKSIKGKGMMKMLSMFSKK